MSNFKSRLPSFKGGVEFLLKGRSRQLRPKAHILDDPLGNPYDVLKVLLWPPWLFFLEEDGSFFLEWHRAISDLCRAIG